MPAEELIFDPNGDLRLHLHLPTNYSYFPDYEANGPADLDVRDTASAELSKDSSALALTDNTSTPDFPIPHVKDGEENPREQSQEDVSTPVPTSRTSPSDTPTPVKKEQLEFEMLVSSKQLMLASPVFKAMLGPHFLEGQPLAQGNTKINLPGNDPEAFIILLGAIHGPADKVLEKISLRTLVQLSVLVHKYEVLESIKLHIEAWIVDLWRPRKLSRSTVLAWLSIFWVFQVKKCFEDLSKVVQRQITSQLRIEVLPIPKHVLGAMEAARRHSISELIGVLNKMIIAYSSRRVQCTSTFGASSHLSTPEKRGACDSLILGSLIRSLSRHGLWPLPAHPYNGITLVHLADIVRDLKVTAICKQILYTTTKPTPLDAHGWMKLLKDEADRIEDEANGLDFDSLVAGTPKLIVYVTEVK
ncbi:hypothetical protein BDZ45DRAFT_796959 [Acephala macrosclerotiorum]|nr:hypothetical protein BDZ45DRAFT_796959 [Acephala macrosclerotiorum]